MRKNFDRNILSLEAVFSFLDHFAQKNHFTPTDLNETRLIVEELFSNIVKYSTNSQKKITIDVSLVGSELLLSIVDNNGQSFDFTQSASYNNRQSLTERPIGKLGLHLVKNLTDEIMYEHKKGQTILTIKKRLKGKDV